MIKTGGKTVKLGSLQSYRKFQIVDRKLKENSSNYLKFPANFL
jgi:hypothetical protein